MRNKYKIGYKGISPLLASVLLIAVTVAIATLVAGWLSTTVRTSQITVSNRTIEATECTGASIVIDDVYIDAGVNQTQRVIVRNAGQSDNMQIISAQLYNITGGNFSARSLPLTGFMKGNVTTLIFNDTIIGPTIVDTCPGGFSKVIVSTNCGGVSAEFTSTPKCI
ncbi:MAG: hypothetical protein HYT72_05765 [Candidatus Aenigmarchaeota archaeon]|nr:hypothetical protein [Candidatus Aenigmarchaeota archaeon]